jgi:DNA-binding NarL/FixJ family response regulator
VRILIGEDEALLREGLLLMLQRAGFTVLDVVEDATRLVRRASELAPDLVLTDIRMPPTRTDDGLRAALAIRAARPATAIVMISQHVQRRYALELVGSDPAGVGYLLKQRITDVDTFCADLRTVADGGTVLDPEVVELMLAHKRRDRYQPGVVPIDRLTDRQRQVLAGMAEGRSNASIARALRIGEKAVVLHASHIYDQLGLPVSEDSHRRVLAVLHYLGGGSAGGDRPGRVPAQERGQPMGVQHLDPTAADPDRP